MINICGNIIMYNILDNYSIYSSGAVHSLKYTMQYIAVYYRLQSERLTAFKIHAQSTVC